MEGAECLSPATVPHRLLRLQNTTDMNHEPPPFRMKVLGICGSPRGSASRTLRLVQAVLQGAGEAGATTECLDLWMYEIQPCTGCMLCHRMGECVQRDDFMELQRELEDADGVVLGSPVYVDNVTGMMKNFVDRLAGAIHCQLLHGKYGCSVSTSRDSGGDEVVAYLNHVLNLLGAIAVGGVSAAHRSDPDAMGRGEEEARALGRTLAGAIGGTRRFPEQEVLLAEIHEDFRPSYWRSGRMHPTIIITGRSGGGCRGMRRDALLTCTPGNPTEPLIQLQ
ncbi:MAG: flavodoxin family protein [Methanomicrobiales archaeon]|nr:flavodoxin family protein [Methanomicrobiales archaeon]